MADLKDEIARLIEDAQEAAYRAYEKKGSTTPPRVLICRRGKCQNRVSPAVSRHLMGSATAHGALGD